MSTANVLLVRWADGWIDVPIAFTGRRKEATLSIGNVTSMPEAVSAAQKVLSTFGGIQERIVAGIYPTTDATTPYSGWRPLPNTYVVVPGWDGSPDNQRVAAISVTQDDESGRITYVPELVDPLSDQNDRVQRWLKRMSNGTIGGQTYQGSPEKPFKPPITPERKPTATFSQGRINEDGSPGAFVTGMSPALPADVRGELREWFISVTDAGSTATIARLYINGTLVATATIAAGATSGFTRVSNVLVTPNIDRLQAEIVQVGTGATGFVGQARVDAIY